MCVLKRIAFQTKQTFITGNTWFTRHQLETPWPVQLEVLQASWETLGQLVAHE